MCSLTSTVVHVREKEHAIAQTHAHVKNLETSIAHNESLSKEDHLRAGTVKAEIERLRASVLYLESQAVDAHRSLQSEEDYKTEIEQALISLRSELSIIVMRERDLRDQIESTKTESVLAERSTGKTISALKDFAKSVDVRDREIFTLEQAISGIQDELKTVTHHHIRVRDSKAAVESRLRDAEGLNNSMHAITQKVRSDMQAVDRTLDKRNDTLKSVRLEIQESLRRSKELEAEILDLETSLRAAQEELENQLGDYMQRAEVRKPALEKHADGIQTEIRHRLTQRDIVEKRITEIDQEMAQLSEETAKETKVHKELMRQISLAQSAKAVMREESFEAMMLRDSANKELRDILGEMEKYSKYHSSRQEELESVTAKVEGLKADRESLELRFAELTDRRREMLGDYSESETKESELRKDIAKRRRLEDTVLRRINDQKRIIQIKSERVKEAELSQKSGELSLSLSGKIGTIDREIEASLAACAEAEGALETIRVRLQVTSEEVLQLDEKVEYIRNVIMVRENQKKRLEGETASSRYEIKSKLKAVEQLRKDLDKIGIIIHRFQSQIEELDTRLRQHVHDDNNIHREKLESLNAQLENEIGELRIAFEAEARDRSELERKLALELVIQKELANKLSEGVDVVDLKKAINQMTAHAVELGKTKEKLRQNILRSMERQDMIQMKRQASSLRRSKGLASCSTTASLYSIASDVPGTTMDLESVIVSHIVNFNSSPQAARGDSLGLSGELAAIRAKLSLLPRKGYFNRLLDWIEYNSKLLH